MVFGQEIGQLRKLKPLFGKHVESFQSAPQRFALLRTQFPNHTLNFYLGDIAWCDGDARFEHDQAHRRAGAEQGSFGNKTLPLLDPPDQPIPIIAPSFTMRACPHRLMKTLQDRANTRVATQTSSF